jgi:hypothetical protein
MAGLMNLEQVIRLGEVREPNLREQRLAQVKEFILSKILGSVRIIRVKVDIGNPV